MKIQQQIDKTSKKVEQKIRYEKEKIRSKRKPKEVIAKDIELPISKVKKELDSWLRSQDNLTSSKIIELEKSNEHHIPLINRQSSIYSMAKDLIQDDNLSICRDTGIMRKKGHGRCSASSMSREDKSTGRSHSSHRGRSCTPDRAVMKGWKSRGKSPQKGRAQCYRREEPWSREMQRAFSPSRDRQRNSESDHSWFSEMDSTSSDGKSSRCHIRRSKNKKIGDKCKTLFKNQS